MADGVSYFSRFTVKFIEISAAGVATAVSGFVLAHLTGYAAAPAAMQPPVVIQAPAVVQAPVMRTPAPLQSTSLQPAPSAGATNQPAAPVAAHVEAPRPAPQPDGNSPAATAALPPLRATVNTAPAEPVHKVVKTEPVKTEPSPAESKPRDAAAAKPETTPHDAAEAKLETKPDSIEARVRAALANADAHRQAPADAHPVVAPGPAIATPVINAQPRPAENPVTRDAVAAPPRTTDIAPPRSADIALQPAQQAPLQIAPSAPVEIKSQPVAGVDASAAPAQADAQAEPKSGDKNPFSVFSKYLRTDTSPPPTDIPRPPMPVGQ